MRVKAEAAGAPRVLLIAELEAAEQGLLESLSARGFRVHAVNGAVDALRALRTEGADVVVLGLPLRGVDAVAACAALKEGAEAPPLVLADTSDQAAALTETLPAAFAPDAVIPRPLDAAKLAMAFHECQQAFGEHVDTAPGVSLPELLVELKRRGTTAVLEIRAVGVCTSIHLREGEPVFAEGGGLQETLGRQLVRRGDIAHDDYARVVERLTEGVIHHQSLRLGEVLVELGLLSPAEVYDALSLQVREKVIACFQWEKFRYELHEPVDGADDLGIYQCPPTEALVLAGIRAHWGPERLAPILGDHARTYPVLRKSVESLLPLYQPSSGEQKLLRAIDGTHSVEGLRHAGIVDPLHADQVLAALSLGCSLALRAQPVAPARPAASRPPPARREAPGTPPAKPEAPAGAPRGRAVLGAIPLVQAFDPLAQLRRRVGRAGPPGASDPKRVRLEAENAFNQGLRLLRESLIPGALRDFRRAVELAPDEPEYRLLEAWVEYRSTSSPDQRELSGAKVRACALSVLELSRTSARAHSVLGQLLLLEGHDETAARHLRLAVRYDERDLEAQRGLRIVERRHRS